MCQIALMDVDVEREVASAQFRGLLEELIQAGDQERLLETVSKLFDDVHKVADESAREIARLRVRVLQLTQRAFGKSSEKIDPNQLRLALEQLRADEFARQDAAKPAVDPDAPASSPPKAKKSLKGRHPGRAPLPEHLPREERRHTTPEAERRCECCGEAKLMIREEMSERLDYRPASLIVVKDVTEVYGCTCGESKPVTTEMPSRVIDGGVPEPGLLAHVVVSKYCDHLPLNRQSKILQREGVTIPPNTLMGWIKACAWTLRPLWKLIDERVLRSWVIQSDDTGLLVLDKQKKGGSRRGRLWANVGDARFVAYHYSPDWRHEHPVRFLAGCAGFLQTDGYKGYEALCDGKGGLAIRAGCFMHARRYFVKALQAGEPEAARPVEIIRALYAVERASKDAGEDADGRYVRRQEHSVQLLEELGDWRLEHAGRYPPKSPMGKALTYLHGQWESLGVFLADGRIELDNGGAERALRGIAVGRRNWLFAGSDAGGERAAILYSIIESAKLHGIEPFAYLRDLLEKLGAGWPMRRLEELMPDRWAAERSIAPPELRVTQLSSTV